MNRDAKERLLPNLLICWRWINKNSAILVLVLALTTFFSAFAGVSILSEEPATKPGPIGSAFNWVTDKLYESAQAMLLDMDPHRDDFNICIGIARLAAVLLVVLVATQAIGRLFKDSITSLRMQFGGKRNVFIGGLGRIGFQLATDYASQGKLVVVQEISETDVWSQAAEDAGAIVVEGDVTDINSLREHIFRDPETIHLVTGNDLVNINALANVRALRREYAEKFHTPLGPAECFVHIDDPGLQRTLTRCLMESTSENDHSLNVHVFNIYHETACQLIIDRLTPLRPRERDEIALYIIFGFEQMGVAMVKELAEYAHFENQKRARILILTPNAEVKCDRCLAQWNRLSPHVVHSTLSEVSFDPQCDEWTSQAARPRIVGQAEVESKAVEYVANVHFCEMKNTDTLSLSDVDQLVRLATESGVRPITLFCFEDDEKNFRLASELNNALEDFHGINRTLGPNGQVPEDKKSLHQRHRELSIPIFAFLPRSRPLREILSESKERYPLRAFGAVNEGLSRAHDDAVEQIALDIAWSYERSLQGTHSQQTPGARFPGPEYIEVWRSKSYWEQHSNLTAAEHAWIKIQMLGYRIVPGGQASGSAQGENVDFAKIPAEKKAMLAMVEHNRWMAERLLLGWAYGQRSDQPPLRSSLCSKKELSQAELVKDFDQIAVLMSNYSARGYQFQKLSDSETAST